MFLVVLAGCGLTVDYEPPWNMGLTGDGGRRADSGSGEHDAGRDGRSDGEMPPFDARPFDASPPDASNPDGGEPPVDGTVADAAPPDDADAAPPDDADATTLDADATPDSSTCACGPGEVCTGYGYCCPETTPRGCETGGCFAVCCPGSEYCVGVDTYRCNSAGTGPRPGGCVCCSTPPFSYCC